jgi:preprotein translocase subunit SecE
MMQRQGQMEADGSVAPRRDAGDRVTSRNRPAAGEQRSAFSRIADFFREVRSELRQVAWPTRPEVINSSAIVLVVLIFLVGLIFCLDYTFAHGVSFLFKT